MNIVVVPSVNDIYLESGGKKIAVVQSYMSKNESDGYRIILHRIYATDWAIANDIEVFCVSDFSLVVCKPDKDIVYSGCRWEDIFSGRYYGCIVAEKAAVVSKSRTEIKK